MRKSVLAIGGFAIAATTGLVIYWRWFPRAGLRWGNGVLNPWLVERGFAGSGASEIGTLEHFGRRTGAHHLTPVHPVPTADGFRIVVPLAERSQWALNVLAAGHCRLQLHDTIFELDEPQLVRPVDVRELSRPARWTMERLGFRYLRLHQFGEAPGILEPLTVDQRPSPGSETPRRVVQPGAEVVVGQPRVEVAGPTEPVLAP